MANKIGRCINIDCDHYKEDIPVPVGEDFECPYCHQPLDEFASKGSKDNGDDNKKKWRKIIIAIISAIVLLVGIGTALYFGMSREEAAQQPEFKQVNDSVTTTTSGSAAILPDTIVLRDTLVVRDTIVKNNTVTTSEKINTKTVVTTTSPSKSSPNKESSGKLKLSYGTYTGATKNGYPHGQGKLIYSTTRQINRRDEKGRTAKAGDYVIGEFHNGFLVYGKHYDASGNLLGSLTIGAGSEDSYESK